MGAGRSHMSVLSALGGCAAGGGGGGGVSGGGGKREEAGGERALFETDVGEEEAELHSLSMASSGSGGGEV